MVTTRLVGEIQKTENTRPRVISATKEFDTLEDAQSYWRSDGSAVRDFVDRFLRITSTRPDDAESIELRMEIRSEAGWYPYGCTFHMRASRFAVLTR